MSKVIRHSPLFNPYLAKLRIIGNLLYALMEIGLC